MDLFTILRGDGPLILGMPHVGTWLPDEIRAKLNDNGAILADTDWHIEKLYADLIPGVTIVMAHFHRYVIDANRDPLGHSLYPGQNTTGLVPMGDFDGKPIWKDGEEPGEADVADRLARFHAPYHQALSDEIARLKSHHAHVVLYDCHSIRPDIPFLFDGTLPDFNIGTDNGKTCAPAIEAAAYQATASATDYRHVLNGRFKGGWTTRHYGRPETGVHAIQMELAQTTHLADVKPPFAYDSVKAGKLRPHLHRILTAILAATATL